MLPDYYAHLSVSPAATRADIARAYRMLMRTHHPDAGTPDGGADPQALQQAMDAYAVLSSPSRRAAYDRALKQQARPDRPAARPRRSRTQADGLLIAVGPVRIERR
ncbi:hypothetical protein BIU82_06305 [Arthrobacter sp. SW1]|uniref:J domain-containing protein n=1 Tax=Arthrobacter sp. SW1 TaxID=1920889 RepID=UPI000877CED5|nr:J domain-containing protein [Arthrobacter sp. SW1]OFI38106.1 hypothetical protein BIU82_06305 [Arthrobacter sp. SW1]